jgi:hypothetical protein
MSSERDDEDPADLLAAFGVADDDAPVDVNPADFSSVHDRIRADLDDQQGPWRRMGWSARAWPVALALFCGGAFAFVLAPAQLGPLAIASCALAGLTAALAFISVLLAPTGPALGEKLALSALVSGAAALTTQLFSGLGGSQGLVEAMPSSLGCGGLVLAGAAVPLVLLGWTARRSGLPLRALHAGGLVAAAFALGGLGIFRHCAPLETWHTVVGHLLIPAAAATVIAVLLYRLLPRRMG